MSIVTLVSGGLDSTVLSILAKEEGIEQFPLFIDYGQVCRDKEFAACSAIHKKYNLPIPEVMDLRGFGKIILSGLTSSTKRINEDAFLPGRNLLFLLVGCSYAFQTGSNAVAIGLLSEENHLFPDQTSEFIEKTQNLLCLSMGRDISILTPLMGFNKRDILSLAQEKRIEGTYSCHAGTEKPCGTCVSCLEIVKSRTEGGI